MAASLKYTLHHYGSENYLQRVGVWEVDPTNKEKYWVVYIHGGAWRDPSVEHDAFAAPSIDWILRTSPENNSNNNSNDSRSKEAEETTIIAGFASLDYRLSAHPRHPQDKATTPPAEYRGAHHPDHIDDVRSGIAHLQRTYGFGGRYVLVGHSAGAALAFQLLSTTVPKPEEPSASVSVSTPEPVLPAALIPFGGLYDFAAIDARHGGAYGVFFTGAFGPGPRAWDAVAPIKFGGNYAEVWGVRDSARVVVLGSSPDDTLVDDVEAVDMGRRLRDVDGFVVDGEGKGEGKKRLVVVNDLKGDHDEVWREGEGVARMVWIALRELGVVGSDSVV